jgi:ATP-dependent helicase/nuclease subunit B
MLRIILGPSGSGKTSLIMREIKDSAEHGGKSILIVPEQFSHDAERQLCASCGASACLYAEVLSFSRLSTRVLNELGGLAVKTLDQGGRVLVMNRALKEAAPGLRTLKAMSRRVEFLEKLLKTYGELKSAAVTAEMLEAAAEADNGPFSLKLRDLKLIIASYEAFIPDGMCDPASRLDILTEKIEKSSIGDGQHIYIDGFSDFTAQELAVIDRLIKKDADVTACFSCDGLNGDGVEFALARKTANRLIRIAAEHRAKCEILNVSGDERGRAPELTYLEENLFSWSAEKYNEKCSSIELYSAPSVLAECELAASLTLSYVRGGYRWRDIAVVARGWEKYSKTAENIFEKYGVPVHVSEKSDILQKPVMALPLAALDVICGGWELKNVLRCLKTELFGDDRQSRDALENYALKWSIRGSSAWRSGDWEMNPSGYSQSMSDDEADELQLVNRGRALAARHLGELEDSMKDAVTGRKKCAAMYDFLCGVDFVKRLEEKTKLLRESGMLRIAEEYDSLWEILVSAMEQYAGVIGDTPQNTDEFSALFRLLLSQYDIGAIPVALDRVSLGDMSRNRRRDLKCLIVMGASEDALPARGETSGILSESERAELKSRGVDISTADDGFEREMNIIYSSLTLPSEKLTVSYNTGTGSLPSFVVLRLCTLFGLTEKSAGREVKTAAKRPCFELAVMAEKLPNDVFAVSAEEYFSSQGEAEIITDIRDTASMPRGRLNTHTAERLYGRQISLSASRAEKFRSCKFSYFVQYGLKAKPRRKAALDAPEAGTFMHYLLENVAREAKAAGGFALMPDEKLRLLTGKYAAQYAENMLGGIEGKSGRFKYLFNRLRRDAETIVLDMAGELRVSDFEPYDFELNFSTGGDLRPAEVTDGDVTVRVGGKVDRVDGWIKGNKLYLRVVDYKTGRTSFSLSDVWYGMGMQMLIYLFVLQKFGRGRYGREIIPAGILYAPARDIIIQAPRGASPEDIEKERAKKLLRTGLILADPDVIEAMEHSASPKYIPVKITKEGLPAGDSLASAEKLGKLAAHIDRLLLEMGRDISGGRIEADPYFKGDQDNACRYCDYFEACRFDEEAGDRRRFIKKLKTAEAWGKIEGDREDG